MLASAVVVAGHTRDVPDRRADRRSRPRRRVQLLPLALLVLLAMAVPTNIGGWGPREGVAAWAFAAAGLGAAQGVATAVVYGVMALVASLPGAVVLVVGLAASRPSRDSRVRERPLPMARAPAAAHARTGRAWLTVPTPC